MAESPLIWCPGVPDVYKRQVLQLLQQLARVLKRFLLGEITVGHRTDDYPLSPVFLGIFDLRPVFDIQKGTPGLGVSGKALHK